MGFPYVCGYACVTQLILSENQVKKTVAAMKDKSVRRIFHFKGYFGVCHSIITALHTNYPPTAKQCWIPYCANNGLCSGTKLNGGRGLMSTF